MVLPMSILLDLALGLVLLSILYNSYQRGFLAPLISLAGTAAGSKDILGDLLAAAVLTTSAEAGVQSRDRAVFQLTIPPGGELRIDSGLYTVLLNGENALHAQEGDWVELSRSLVRLTVECAQGGGLAGQIVYQERYL